MRTAMLRRLRLLLACLFFAVAARPAVTALETPRAVAVAVASVSGGRGAAAPERTVARRVARAPADQALFAARPASPRHGAEHGLSELERPPRDGLPLYLMHERFLL